LFTKRERGHGFVQPWLTPTQKEEAPDEGAFFHFHETPPPYFNPLNSFISLPIEEIKRLVVSRYDTVT
jgi:hypothetical protein